jgi:inositol oxygenase
MRKEYSKLNRVEMSIWECCELLNEVVDESDPDLDVPQIEHLLQTAEAIRKDYPNEDWLHLTGLIHGIDVFNIYYVLLDLIGLHIN